MSCRDERRYLVTRPDHATSLGIAYLSTRTADERRELERIIRADAQLMRLLEVGRDVSLPQWRLVAGCIYQTVWNRLTGRPRGTGINDYDLIYFDDQDLSKEGEDTIEQRVREFLPNLSAPVEVRNQARVHLWFEDYFGFPYTPLTCADEAIDRYASKTHAVGVRLGEDGEFDIYAPFGLDDIFGMIMRPNYALPNKRTHDRKAERAKAIWPELNVLAW